MAARTLPNLGLQAFFTLGEDGWKDEMDSGLLRLSVLVQPVVSSLAAALPGSPVAGDTVVLNAAHGTHPNQIAVYDDGAWVYITPHTGWKVYSVAAAADLRFNGSAWVTIVEGGGGDTGYRVGCFFTTAPTASELLLSHVFTDAVTFADEFAGAQGHVSTNPAATFTMDVQKNGASVGSIAISTSGVFTFATTGTTVVFAAGDRLRIIGPASVGTAANVSITLKGSL